MIDIWEFVRDKEYHIDDKLLFINNYDFDAFANLFKDVNWVEDEVQLHFKGSYFCVDIEEMINAIDCDLTQEIVDKLKYINK